MGEQFTVVVLGENGWSFYNKLSLAQAEATYRTVEKQRECIAVFLYAEDGVPIKFSFLRA